MANRWLCLVAILVPLFAAGCGAGLTSHTEDQSMYRVSTADFVAEDANIPADMKPIGMNPYPRLTMLGLSTADGRCYIGLSKETKLQRYEDGKWSTPNLRDFKSGMYIKIPYETQTYLTFPGQRYPYSTILSSKPIPLEVLPESNVLGHVNESMLSIASRIPGTESLVLDTIEPSHAMKPDKRFSAYSYDGRVTAARKVRYRRAEDQAPVIPLPFQENQLMAMDLQTESTGVSQKSSAERRIWLNSDTKVERCLNGTLSPGQCEQIKKGMFIRCTTYSDNQGPTWLVYSDAEIPSSVHDPRIPD